MRKKIREGIRGKKLKALASPSKGDMYEKYAQAREPARRTMIMARRNNTPGKPETPRSIRTRVRKNRIRPFIRKRLPRVLNLPLRSKEPITRKAKPEDKPKTFIRKNYKIEKEMGSKLYFGVYKTGWGFVGVGGREEALLRSTPPLGEDEVLSIFKDWLREDRLFKDVGERLSLYFEGERVEFKDRVELELSEFKKRVLELVREIPYGETRTYGYISKILKTGARAVGGALRENPLPIIIPCHRVVGKGNPGGYKWGEEMKMKLLKLEGSGNFMYTL